MKKITVLVLVMVSGLLVSCGKQKKYDLQMVDIPGKEFKMLQTEVTQELYKAVMRKNPSKQKGKNKPVGNLSWYDAIYFCNKLSEMEGKSPVYYVKQKSTGKIIDVAKSGYKPHKEEIISDRIIQDLTKDGYRLPSLEECIYAAKGGQNYRFSGSDWLDEVGWCTSNCKKRTFQSSGSRVTGEGNLISPVAQKDPNGYGLYDMSGNVSEWCWDDKSNSTYPSHPLYGGSIHTYDHGCEVGKYLEYSGQSADWGFRIVCSTSK